MAELGPGGDEGAAKEREYAEYERALEKYKSGESQVETLKTSENPRAIRLAGQRYMLDFEDIRYSNQNQRSPYDLNPIVRMVADRAGALEISHKDLTDEKEGWGVVAEIKEDNTGVVNVAGYALGERIKIVKRRRGKSFEDVEISEPYIGSEVERTAAAEALREVLAQVVIEGNLHNAYLYHEKNSENLAGFAKVYLGDNLTGEALETYFNLSPLWKEKSLKTDGGKEIASRGQMVHMAMRIYEIIGLSEKKEELNSFRERPGWQELFPGSTKEKPTGAELKWIGKVNEWKGGFRESGDVVEQEFTDKERGLFTEYGNILADPQPEQIDEIRERIRRFLGGGKNAPPYLEEVVRWAEEKAYRINRTWGIMDNRGWEIYEPETGQYKLQMTMGPGITSDYLKIIAPTLYRWKNKQFPKRRDAGPVYTSDRFKKLMVSLPELLSYSEKVTIKKEDGKEVKEKRTIQELIWGYKGETIVTKDGDKEYLNFGDVEWRKFGRYPEMAFFLRIFMVAREQDGIYDLTRKANWTPKDLSDMVHHDWWEQLMKRIEVGFPDNVVARGALRGKSKEEYEQKTYEFWSGILNGVWDGLRSSNLYESLMEEGARVAIPGTTIVVSRSTIDEIQKVVKDIMGVDLKTDVLDLKEIQEIKPFWEKDISQYQYPYPDYIEIE